MMGRCGQSSTWRATRETGLVTSASQVIPGRGSKRGPSRAKSVWKKMGASPKQPAKVVDTVRNPGRPGDDNVKPLRKTGTR